MNGKSGQRSYQIQVVGSDHSLVAIYLYVGLGQKITELHFQVPNGGSK